MNSLSRQSLSNLFFQYTVSSAIDRYGDLLQALPYELLQQLGIVNDRFDIDPELSAKIVRSGQRIYEVPVSYAGRPYLAGKKIRPVDALSAFKTPLGLSQLATGAFAR